MLTEEQRIYFESKLSESDIKKIKTSSIEKKDLSLLELASKTMTKKTFIKSLYPLPNRYKLADFFYNQNNKNENQKNIISLQILLNELPRELR